MRRVLVALPAAAKDLENALHSACDSGHWEGEVQLVLDTNVNQYRLELVYDDNAGTCPYHRSVIDYTSKHWRLACDIDRDKTGFATPCPNCGRLPCERYEKHKEE